MEQDSEFLMASRDVDSLFTNVAHVGSINFCAYKSVENTERAEGLSKTEFKNLHLLLQENPFLFLMES